MPAPGQYGATQCGERITRGLARLVERNAFGDQFLETGVQLQLTLHDRRCPHIEDDRIGGGWKAKGNRIGAKPRFPGAVRPDILEGTWRPPESDGSGRDREQARRALRLLTEAGYVLQDGVLQKAATGEPLRFEFLAASRVQERLALQTDPAWSINLNTDANSAPDFIANGRFDCAMAQVASDSLSGAWGFTTHEQIWLPFAVMGGMAVGMLFILLILLKRRDPV